ncbi:MAG: DUF2155 domain-containing protein [Pseudomonadota bacterium]
MIRTLALSTICVAAVGIFAMAQDTDQPDYSNVDAALEALIGPNDASVSEVSATDPVGPDDDAPAIDPLTGEPIEGDGEEEEEATPLIENTWLQNGEATLRGLDKITGRSTDFSVTVGEPKVFGSLEITLATCFARPPEQAPENSAFLSVASVAPMETEAGLEETPQIFSGWMFSSSPGLNALEHPVYDVWVIGCGAASGPAE